jgi:hypothetical protein
MEYVKNFFATPDGLWLALGVVYVITWFGSVERLAATSAAAFTGAAIVLARHFDFALPEQYEIAALVYVGVNCALSRPK